MDIILSFINRWLGTALPQLFLLFLGVLLVIVVVTALWDRRINIIGGSIGALTGLFMVSIALEEGIAQFIGGLDSGLRIRLIAVLFSLFLLILTMVAWGKTGLQKRYGLTWTAVSLIVLLTASFPHLLSTFPSLLGVRYGLAIAGLFIIFLLLLVFHFSITISELYKNQQNLLLRINRLEGSEQVVEPEEQRRDKNGVAGLLTRLKEKLNWQGFFARFTRRPVRGTTFAAPLIILVAVCSVLLTGLSAPQVMVGDEVTHYYMMETQAQVLPQPNFKAIIPTEWGSTLERTYPHSFLWHYLGAILFLLTGGSFAAIQLYQALFLAQFLGVAYLLARSRRGVETRSALPYLLILASIPMTLMFSVTFYQDMPMAAQVLTAFYLLRKNRWLLATLFMGFALGVKVTAMLFFPGFFLCLLLWTIQRCSKLKTLAIFCCSVLLISMCTWGLGNPIHVYTGTGFYPLEKLRSVVSSVQRKISLKNKTTSVMQQIRKPVQPVTKGKVDNEKNKSITRPVIRTKTIAEFKAEYLSERHAAIISNHPGDLRVKVNYFVYGGFLLWLLILTSGVAIGLQNFGLSCKHPVREKSYWLWGVGLSYTFLVAIFLKNSPDARFFLPGLPFILLPIAEKTVCLPRPKWVISLIASLAILQGGYVLGKTYNLRSVSPEIKEAIVYLKNNSPEPRGIFMYPEGNYRLFPNPPQWYLNYSLRYFWRTDNDTRIAMLLRHKVGAIVIKKYLVAPVDKEITNLGVYPDYFVKEIQGDNRFTEVFDNKNIVIYRIEANENSVQ